MQASALVQQLEQYIDTFAGDALAGLPDQDRTAGSPFSRLAEPLLAFATAVLKFKLSMPSTVKLLRRLLAALLPDGNSEGANSVCRGDACMHAAETLNPKPC